MRKKKPTLFLFFYLGMLHVHRPKSSTVDSLIYSQITSLWELFFLCNLPKVFFFFSCLFTSSGLSCFGCKSPNCCWC